MPPFAELQRVNRLAIYAVTAAMIITLLIQTVTILHGWRALRREQMAAAGVRQKLVERQADHEARLRALERREKKK